MLRWGRIPVCMSHGRFSTSRQQGGSEDSELSAPTGSTHSSPYCRRSGTMTASANQLENRSNSCQARARCFGGGARRARHRPASKYAIRLRRSTVRLCMRAKTARRERMNTVRDVSVEEEGKKKKLADSGTAPEGRCSAPSEGRLPARIRCWLAEAANSAAGGSSAGGKASFLADDRREERRSTAEKPGVRLPVFRCRSIRPLPDGSLPERVPAQLAGMWDSH